MRQLVEPEHVDLKQVRLFWIRRWFRTLPNYYLVLQLNIVVVAIGLNSDDLAQFNWKFLFFSKKLVVCASEMQKK